MSVSSLDSLMVSILNILRTLLQVLLLGPLLFYLARKVTTAVNFSNSFKCIWQHSPIHTTYRDRCFLSGSTQCQHSQHCKKRSIDDVLEMSLQSMSILCRLLHFNFFAHTHGNYKSLYWDYLCHWCPLMQSRRTGKSANTNSRIEKRVEASNL